MRRQAQKQTVVICALLLLQVIKESQRLFPAAAIGPIRIAAENAELGGYFIPKGTRVQVTTLPASILDVAPCFDPGNQLIFLWCIVKAPLHLRAVMTQELMCAQQRVFGVPGAGHCHSSEDTGLM